MTLDCETEKRFLAVAFTYGLHIILNGYLATKAKSIEHVIINKALKIKSLIKGDTMGTPVAAPAPFDLKGLLEGLKSKAVDVEEEAARDVVNAVFEWLEQSAAASDNIYLKFISPILDQVKPLVLAEVDKINGKVD